LNYLWKKHAILTKLNDSNWALKIENKIENILKTNSELLSKIWNWKFEWDIDWAVKWYKKIWKNWYETNWQNKVLNKTYNAPKNIFNKWKEKIFWKAETKKNTKQVEIDKNIEKIKNKSSQKQVNNPDYKPKTVVKQEPKIKSFKEVKKILKFKPKWKAVLLWLLWLSTYTAAWELSPKSWTDEKIDKKIIDEKLQEKINLWIANKKESKENIQFKNKLKNFENSEKNILKFTKENLTKKEKFLENPENRKNLKNKLKNFWDNYKNFLIEMKKYFSENKEFKKELVKDLDINEKVKISETVFLIKNNSWELELKYISEDNYRKWIHSQFVSEPSWNRTLWIANETLVEWWTSMIPFYWSWRDLKRSYEKYQSWNYKEALTDFKWWVAWMAFDVTSLVAWVLTFWSWAIAVQATKAWVFWTIKWVAKSASKTIVKTTWITEKTAKSVKLRSTQIATWLWIWMIWMSIAEFWTNQENYDKSEIIK